MVRRVRPRCAAYDVAWWQWGQGRGEKGGCLSGTRGESLWMCREEGAREYMEGYGDAEEKKVGYTH